MLQRHLVGADRSRMRDDGSPTEDFESHFWLSTATIGGWVTMLMALAGAAYAVGFSTGSTRLGVGIMIFLTAVVAALVLWVIPWPRVIGSRRRELWFLAWSLLTVASIAVMAAIDGGSTSPLAIALILPTVFASLAYGLARVLIVAVLAELAFASLTLIGPANQGYDLIFCSVLFGTAVMAVWQASFHEAWRAKLSRSSRTDPLTDVLNRRGLNEAAAAAFAQLDRHGRPVTLLVIDLDLFKSYNDIHGHQAGDALLGWVAAELRSAVRPGDTVARIGGDEFAVLLPDTSPAVAEPLVNRIRSALEPRIGHCVGRALAPLDGVSFDELYRAADADLYQCKLLRGEDLEEVGMLKSMTARHGGQRPLSADAILAGITEAFFVLDRSWRFAYVNRAAATMLERDAYHLLGREIWDVFPETVGSRFEQVYRRVLASGSSERFFEHYEPLGTTFSVKASPVPGGISVYFHDVGEEAKVPTRPSVGVHAASRTGTARDFS